jgi:hypothetical protein
MNSLKKKIYTSSARNPTFRREHEARTSSLCLGDLGGEVSLGALVGLEEGLALEVLLEVLAHVILQSREQLHQLVADLLQTLNLSSLSKW